MPSSSSGKKRSRGRPRSRLTAVGRSALTRVLTLHVRLASERSVSSRAMADELGICMRTVRRDMEILRDVFGAPVRWEPTTRTYYYEGECEVLPLFKLEPDEILALATVAATFGSWQTQPLGRAIRTTLQKIARALGGGIHFGADTDPTTAAIVTSNRHPAQRALIERECRYFAALLRATQRHQVVELVYGSPRGRRIPEPPRRVQPLLLTPLDHRWALLANDLRSGERRTFILSRIHTATVLAERFTSPAGFDAQEEVHRATGAFLGGTVITARIAFDPEIFGYVDEKPWHGSQELTELPDGSGEAVYQVTSLIPLLREVLACGGKARALSPPALCDAVREGAAQLLTRHPPAAGAAA